MSISLKTHKMLWGRAANRCAICKIELAVDKTEVDDESLIGDECHIIARQDGGPRGNTEPLPSDNRDTYENLLLLCKNHHKQVDDQRIFFTADKLRQIKTEHENWVKSSLNGFDKTRQRDEEVYVSYVDDWEQKVCLDNWMVWTSELLSTLPHLSSPMKARLEEVPHWLLSRVWPRRYMSLEDSFVNFRLVLSDLLRVFLEHAEEISQRYEIVKFYKGKDGWNDHYSRDLQAYRFHVDLIHDLTFELTRSANYVCDQIRQCLMSNYRVSSGHLLLSRISILDEITYCPQYDCDNSVKYMYPGLNEFFSAREKRDFYFGSGTASEFFRYSNAR